MKRFPEELVEAAARAHYIAEHSDRRGEEWAARAWADMGGSEPTVERSEAEIAMEEALEVVAAHFEDEVTQRVQGATLCLSGLVTHQATMLGRIMVLLDDPGPIDPEHLRRALDDPTSVRW